MGVSRRNNVAFRHSATRTSSGDAGDARYLFFFGAGALHPRPVRDGHHLHDGSDSRSRTFGSGSSDRASPSCDARLRPPRRRPSPAPAPPLTRPPSDVLARRARAVHGEELRERRRLVRRSRASRARPPRASRRRPCPRDRAGATRGAAPLASPPGSRAPGQSGRPAGGGAHPSENRSDAPAPPACTARRCAGSRARSARRRGEPATCADRSPARPASWSPSRRGAPRARGGGAASRSRAALRGSRARSESCAASGSVACGVASGLYPSTWTTQLFTGSPRSCSPRTPPLFPSSAVTCPCSSQSTTLPAPAAPPMMSLPCVCTHASVPLVASKPITRRK